MKNFKCPNCKHIRMNVKENIVVVRCGCGFLMEEVDSNHKPLTTPMKICDRNKCESCPIRGTECFGN